MPQRKSFTIFSEADVKTGRMLLSFFECAPLASLYYRRVDAPLTIAAVGHYHAKAVRHLDASAIDDFGAKAYDWLHAEEQRSRVCIQDRYDYTTSICDLLQLADAKHQRP